MNKRITRAVYVVFIVITTIFVALLTIDVARQVFTGESSARGAMTANSQCARGVSELAAAVDRAIIAASERTADVEAALSRYRVTRDEKWTQKDEVTASCAAEPRGADALAALARLDREAEGTVRRQASALSTVRREVDSIISSPR